MHSKDFGKEYVCKEKFTPKPCDGEKRERIERRCNEFKGFMKFGCVVDLCANVPKEIEEITQIEKEKMKNVKLITPGVVIERKRLDASQLNPGAGNMCISWGDPHFTSFKGTKFNNYFLGDHLLLKTKRFTIQVRQRRWGAASVNVLFAAKINGVIVEANKPSSFLLNRRERINIKIGQTIALKAGGKVERIEKDRWLLVSKNGGYADIVFNYYGGKLRVGSTIYQRRYINFIVKVPHPNRAKGFCQAQVIKTSTLFSKPYLSLHKSQKIKVISKKCKRSARLRCLNRHVKKGDLINCIFDLCNGFSGKMIRKFEKNVKHDRRRWHKIFKHKKKVTRKHVHRHHKGRRHSKHHRKHHKKSRRGGFVFSRHSKRVRRTRRRATRVRRARVVRRRARGDVWLKDAHHKWVDVNAIGTFNYLIDNKENLSIQVQFGKLGKGSIMRGVAVSYAGKKIVAEKDGSVTVDGKLVEAPSAEFNFENKQFNIKPDNTGFGIYTFSGILKEGFKIHYEKKIKIIFSFNTNNFKTSFRFIY